MAEPQEEDIRVAMDQAWRDHHHARDQTWKALQMVTVLAAGVVGVDAQFAKPHATLAAALLTIVGTAFGMAITLRHRNNVEVLKFTHITNCQNVLHLDQLLGDISIPERLHIWDVFLIWKNNTSLFILRLYIVIALFVALFASYRWYQ
jgi:hypothetical protein